MTNDGFGAVHFLSRWMFFFNLSRLYIFIYCNIFVIVDCSVFKKILFTSSAYCAWYQLYLLKKAIIKAKHVGMKSVSTCISTVISIFLLCMSVFNVWINVYFYKMILFEIGTLKIPYTLSNFLNIWHRLQLRNTVLSPPPARWLDYERAAAFGWGLPAVHSLSSYNHGN